MSLHLSQSVFNSRNSNQDLDSFPGWATSLDASLEHDVRISSAVWVTLDKSLSISSSP